MILFAIKSPFLFSFVHKIPLLNKFFELDVRVMDKLNSTMATNHIFKHFSNADSTYKTTGRYRFNELNDAMLSNLPKTNYITIHDVGVSSGITSLELYEQLKKLGIAFRLTISDKFATFFVEGNFITRIYDSNGSFVKGYFGCLATKRDTTMMILSKLLFNLLKTKQYSWHGKKLLLIDSLVIEKLNNKDIEFMDYDVFKSGVFEKFNFVRCMNVLNIGCFNDDMIKIAIKHIYESIADGGILMLGRTEESGINNVTFFKKQGKCFVLCNDVNSGSELKDIVLGFCSKS